MPLAPAYREFYRAIARTIPKKNIILDPLRRVAIGVDASFYRLVPQIIVDVEQEKEVQAVLREARRLRLPVTFRAAGTSLSGQSITDSILVRLGRGWDRCQISGDAATIRLQPGIIGGYANRQLAVFDRKIGPDPASIDSAKIGGILANNASGMCCGVEQNSYQTLASIRLILADGTIVDTGDAKSVADFRASHAGLLTGLTHLRDTVLTDPALTDKIRRKFKIKNTTGYSLNALVDYHDPIDIMAHLMIGSEGTLAFIADATFTTVIEHRYKATALILFTSMEDACRAIPILRSQPVAAAELMDRASLASVQDQPGMPPYLKGLDQSVTALLVETRTNDADQLTAQVEAITASLAAFQTVMPISFTSVPAEFQALWKIRKGLFPAVGAVRQTGTTVIIEDVAFPTERLASAALELQDLFATYRYHEAIIFGHAFEGNLHFVFTQDFSSPAEVARYRDFMAEVVEMVVTTYDGSLKAEHGTGRNMAPFVEKEWGPTAYALMKRIKALFDPANLLNPGVILNEDAEAHIHHLKPLPATHEIADTCIECGFCEPVCPSRDLSFTPRQRIAGRREISRRLAAGAGGLAFRRFTARYQYPGIDTCAADGLCATRCPVGIDTGKMVKALRQEAHGPLATKIAATVGNHFAPVSRTIAHVLDGVDLVHRSVGTTFMEQASSLARKATFNRLPLWNREMPTGSGKITPESAGVTGDLRVVYFPSCASRAMGGPARHETERHPLPTVTASLLHKAGYRIIHPHGLDGLCCGQAFESKGFTVEADRRSAELSAALLAASDNGAVPILCDTSPCLQRMRATLDRRLRLFEPIEFVLEFLRDRLSFKQKEATIAIHPTCSTRKMGLEKKLLELAQACATRVIWPEDIHCCGFAGDRGFTFPELNKSALNGLAEQVSSCEAGYSTSKTCEVGLSLHAGIPYRSILALVDEVSQPKWK
ncbi:FAD-binding and (Fe-S)-binding domain-containing protein [Desulfofustis limnaeus]|uniref:D-lactate dehydrogenase (cytochrome) n=1 Tax=Desulfofustis limnaeus TaxID=2740163 RepID=A0ABM7W6G7_9BACT|nr:FAD-binding and (Fe-S)-binding domain-containing protein [Desulfofustis limnaeus]BDD86476.1 oxidoreductase [Desulfofustis limnaeus]